MSTGFLALSFLVNLPLNTAKHQITYVLSCLEHLVAAAIEATNNKIPFAVKRIKVVWTVRDSGTAETFIRMLDRLVDEASHAYLPISVQVSLTQYVGRPLTAIQCEVASGRPDLTILLDRMADLTTEHAEGQGNGIFVGACGSLSLIRGTRKAVYDLARVKADRA